MKNIIASNFYSSATPVAIIYHASTSKQTRLTGTLETILLKHQQNPLSHPSIIIIGHTVKLQKQLNWLKNRPLHGKRIILFRPPEQCSPLYEDLSLLGADVILAPSIKCTPLKTNLAKITKPMLSKYTLILFYVHFMYPGPISTPFPPILGLFPQFWAKIRVKIA